MNLLTVSRFNFNKDWTISRLLIMGKHDGYAVEDEIREKGKKVKGETAIWYGTYPLGYRQSPKFSNSFLYSDTFNLLIEPKESSIYKDVKDFRPHDLIWVKDVPDFEYILLHFGNTDKDSDGCLILGSNLGVIDGREGVVNSRSYYKKFYPKVYPLVKKGGQFIEYIKA